MVMAATMARQTIQLHRIALTKTVIMPGVAERGVADRLGLRDRDDFGGDSRRRGVPKLVSAIASRPP